MEKAAEETPSARLFLGPGDELFGFSRIWILIHKARHEVVGRNGDNEYDEKVLSLCLRLHSKDAAFDTLLAALRDNWKFNHAFLLQPSPHSVSSPFWPNQPQAWTVDFDRERIFVDREHVHLVHPLSLPLRFNAAISVRKFKPYTPIDLPIWTPKHLLSWTPPDVVPQQLFDLAYRLVSDYWDNWQRLGFSFNLSSGLQNLGFGILSIFTLNFKADLRTPDTFEGTSWHIRSLGCDLLRWRSWPSPLVTPTISLGSTVVMFFASLDNAARIVQDHYMQTASERETRPDITYVVTSISSIRVFHRTSTTLSSTPAISFLSPNAPPSPRAVSCLLNTIHGHWYPLNTRIHTLPVELQELILSHVSDCDIDRATYAALLGVGLHFPWSVGHGKDKSPLRLLKMRYPNHITTSHSKQDITIFDDYVGLSYQPDDRTEGEEEEEERAEEIVLTSIYCKEHEEMENLRLPRKHLGFISSDVCSREVIRMGEN